MKKIAVCLICLLVLTCGNVSSAVERRSCRCGFTAAGDCKPCGGGEDADMLRRGCAYGYDEAGNCLKGNESSIKRCLCGYGAGKCLPCKDDLIERSKNNKSE